MNNIDIKFIYCPICNKNHYLEKRLREVTTSICGVNITYNEFYFECKDVLWEDNIFVTVDLMNENLRQIGEQFRAVEDHTAKISKLDKLINKINSVNFDIFERVGVKSIFYLDVNPNMSDEDIIWDILKLIRHSKARLFISSEILSDISNTAQNLLDEINTVVANEEY